MFSRRYNFLMILFYFSLPKNDENVENLVFFPLIKMLMTTTTIRTNMMMVCENGQYKSERK